MRQEKRISPSEVEIIQFRDDRTPLLVKLVTGETLEGVIRWYDERVLRLAQPDQSEVTVYLQAIAYYKART